MGTAWRGVGQKNSFQHILTMVKDGRVVGSDRAATPVRLLVERVAASVECIERADACVVFLELRGQGLGILRANVDLKILEPIATGHIMIKWENGLMATVSRWYLSCSWVCSCDGGFSNLCVTACNNSPFDQFHCKPASYGRICRKGLQLMVLTGVSRVNFPINPVIQWTSIDPQLHPGGVCHGYGDLLHPGALERRASEAVEGRRTHGHPAALSGTRAPPVIGDP